MAEIFSDTTFWQAVGYVIGTALAFGIAALSAKYAAKYSKETIYYIRHYSPKLAVHVNETTDPAIVFLDKYIPGQADKVLVALLTAILKALSETNENKENM